MPLYDYRCTKCKHIWEVNKKITEPHPTECPNCNSTTIERYHGNSDQLVQYKGKGWMKTDGKY